MEPSNESVDPNNYIIDDFHSFWIFNIENVVISMILKDIVLFHLPSFIGDLKYCFVSSFTQNFIKLHTGFFE